MIFYLLILFILIDLIHVSLNLLNKIKKFKRLESGLNATLFLVISKISKRMFLVLYLERITI